MVSCQNTIERIIASELITSIVQQGEKNFECRVEIRSHSEKYTETFATGATTASPY